jgi:DNA polymerase III epsilon subunit-like protein
MINSLMIYDLETNGFFVGNPNPCAIEVALLYVDIDGVVEYNELVGVDLDGSPIKVSSKITEITSITNEMLRVDGIPTVDAMIDLRDYVLDCDMVIGHNSVRFDNLFIQHLSGLNLHSKTYDTGGEYKARVMGWKKFDSVTFGDFHKRVLDMPRKGLKWNLETSCNECGIPTMEGRHRAIVDVRMTAKLFLHQWTEYNEEFPINEEVLTNLRNHLNQ